MVTEEQLVCTKHQAVLLKHKGAPQKTLFAWTERDDMYGKLYVLDENLGEGWAAYTTAEMIDIMPKMGWLERFLFTFRTGLEPEKVAEHLIQKL